MNTDKLISELSFKAVRSSGAGGQNVNKVSSKVILAFDLLNSAQFSEEQKILLTEKLASRLTADNILQLSCDEDRSQFRNKQLVIKRFVDLIQNALMVRKPRRATKVPRSVIEKRIRHKRNVSGIKELRKKPRPD